ncbi:unnamed protein product [Prunus armeniaca]|uniref:Uncharacterized protein n=1 Tax=Prunus armeniaca TaxID=36596 RepID=A0A6J5X8J2_PRUAR|nr:unnamed protein product [Prunus armeniaca]
MAVLAKQPLKDHPCEAGVPLSRTSDTFAQRQGLCNKNKGARILPNLQHGDLAEMPRPLPNV